MKHGSRTPGLQYIVTLFGTSCPCECQDSSAMRSCGSFVCLFRHFFPHNLFSNLETGYQFCLFLTCLATCVGLYIFQSQTGYQQCLCNGCEGTVCLSSLCTAGHLVRHCAICSQGCPLGFPVQKEPCLESLNREQLCFEWAGC